MEENVVSKEVSLDGLGRSSVIETEHLKLKDAQGCHCRQYPLGPHLSVMKAVGSISQGATLSVTLC